MPPTGKYLTVDLVCFASSGEIFDPNQENILEHPVDVVAAMELLRYIRDIPVLLQRCVVGTPNWIVSYPLAAAGDDIEARRAQGRFNEF